MIKYVCTKCEKAVVTFDEVKSDAKCVFCSEGTLVESKVAVDSAENTASFVAKFDINLEKLRETYKEMEGSSLLNDAITDFAVEELGWVSESGISVRNLILV